MEKPKPMPKPQHKAPVSTPSAPKERPRETRRKRPFVKKDKVYMCSNLAGKQFKIYANDEEDARTIFKGIHKEDAIRVIETKPHYKRRKNLTDRPFSRSEDLKSIKKEID